MPWYFTGDNENNNLYEAIDVIKSKIYLFIDRTGSEPSIVSWNKNKQIETFLWQLSQ